MDLEKINKIVNQDELPNIHKRDLILSVIANDKDAIPYILQILNFERKDAKELLLDQNAELSRALIVLNDKNLKAKKNIIVEPSFVVEEIKKHYLKWKNKIKCNFKVEGLP